MSRRSAATDVYLAIADPTRRRLLDLLGQGEQSVMGLAESFDMTLSAISQHLRLLREVGLVSVRPVGRERFYRLSAQALVEVANWVQSYERFWRTKLDALGEHLKRNP
jgi:DNA-binding transcriptional ArsR family regulator